MALTEILHDIASHRISKEEGQLQLAAFYREEDDVGFDPKPGATMTTNLQQHLKHIVEKKMGLSGHKFTIDDNFSRLGIDSISASQIIDELKKTHDLTLANTVIFEYPTIRKFVQFLITRFQASLEKTWRNDEAIILAAQPEKNKAKQTKKKSDNLEIQRLWDEAARVLREERVLYDRERNKCNLRQHSRYDAMFKQMPDCTTVMIKKANKVSEFIIIGSGKPVLFISGIQTLATLWQAQIKAFHTTHQLILYHPPGYGRTSLYQAHRPSFRTICKTLMEGIDDLKLKQTIPIIGWSLGASIGMECALMYPTQIDSIALVNATPSAINGQIPFETLKKDLKKSKKLKLFEETVQVDDPFDSQVLTFYKKLFNRWDITGKLHKIKQPTCIISGGQDSYATVANSHIMADKIEQAAHHTIKTAGHFIPITNTDRFNKILKDFLLYH